MKMIKILVLLCLIAGGFQPCISAISSKENVSLEKRKIGILIGGLAAGVIVGIGTVIFLYYTGPYKRIKALQSRKELLGKEVDHLEGQITLEDERKRRLEHELAEQERALKQQSQGKLTGQSDIPALMPPGKPSSEAPGQLEVAKILNKKSTAVADINFEINHLMQNPDYLLYLETPEAKQLIDETKQRITKNFSTVVRLTKELGDGYQLGEITNGIDTPINDKGQTLLMHVLYNLGSIDPSVFDQLFLALLDAQADPNATSKKKATPFDFLTIEMKSIAWSDIISESDKNKLLPRGWKCIEILKRYGAQITPLQEEDLRKAVADLRQQASKN